MDMTGRWECVGDSMSRIGIIAAMERELHPLVAAGSRPVIRDRRKRTSLLLRADVQCFAVNLPDQRHRQQAAEATARAVVKKYQPEILISAGVAGALMRTLKVGNVVCPT